jgi:predicted nucleic acid-binding protein
MIVVDASFAVKWLFEEEYSDTADAIAAAVARQNEPVIAPYLLPIEVTNTIRQRRRRGALTLEEARGRLSRFFSYRVRLLAPDALSERALTLADDHNLTAVYDAHYIALAELAGCDLWTADQRLIRSLSTPLPYVRWIGDYVEGQTAL